MPAPLASMSEIEPGLFIGNVWSSYDADVLRENAITARLSLVNGRSGQWGIPMITELVPIRRELWIECVDSSTQDLITQMRKACDFIDQMLSTPVKMSMSKQPAVLVHCDQGVSRSPTIVIAYLMRKYSRKLEDVLAEVKTKRKIRPSANFMDQLRVWEQVGYQIWEDEEKQIPKLPYLEYKERRAAALKAKGLTGNEPIRPMSLEGILAVKSSGAEGKGVDRE